MKKNTIATAVYIIIVITTVSATYIYQQNKISKLNDQAVELVTEKSESNDYLLQPKALRSNKGLEIKIYKPHSMESLSSPLIIFGEVPGKWSFEASFPIYLEDSSGNRLSTGIAQLQDDWMTDKLVPFVARLEFTIPQAGPGKIILTKDNPSGEPENDDYVIIPVNIY